MSSSTAAMPDSRASHDYLSNRHFVLILLMALVLHMVALYLWHRMPQTEVMDIPVRALNIKLGDGEESSQEAVRIAQPGADNQKDVESVISQMVQPLDDQMPAVAHPANPHGAQASKALDKAMAADAPAQESARKLSGMAKQFVRANGLTATNKTGTEKDAEMMSRYEQLISLWIEKFKLYPDEARAENMQGDTLVRIRIDRQGNIRYYILEHSTGYALLDRAAIDMVKRANPVPAVPHDYPKADLIEFLIPVNFHLQ